MFNVAIGVQDVIGGAFGRRAVPKMGGYWAALRDHWGEETRQSGGRKRLVGLGGTACGPQMLSRTTSSAGLRTECAPAAAGVRCVCVWCTCVRVVNAPA
jgi:hypothetical protein